MKTTYLFILLLSFFIISCEKTYDLPDENFEPKIVVNCLINPDSTIRVNLTENYKLYEFEPASAIYTNDLNYICIDNATIELYENENFIQLIKLRQNGNYITETFKPKKGNYYTLKIETPDYPQVTATTFIPDNIGSIKINNQNSLQLTDDNYFDDTFNLTVNDEAEKNFYYFSMSIDYKSLGYNNDLDILVDNPAMGYITPNSNYSGYLIFDDLYFSESSYNFDVVITTSYDTWGDSTYIMLNLANLSEDLYNYLNSFNKTIQSSNYYSEPVKIYSNIEGGYGIFGGYCLSKDSVKINNQL
jgi:hypothetical protein